jgi:hypothetical protein
MQATILSAILIPNKDHLHRFVTFSSTISDLSSSTGKITKNLVILTGYKFNNDGTLIGVCAFMWEPKKLRRGAKHSLLSR